MIHHSNARRVLLVITALVFAVIAVASLLHPHEMAAPLGYTLSSVDALNEYRAVYVGLWLATAVVFVIAARRIDIAVLGDCAGLLVFGQTAGRVISLVLDGAPSAHVWPMFALEAMGAVAVFVVRPSVRAAIGRQASG